MKHIIFAEEQNKYPIAILTKESSFTKTNLLSFYVKPLEDAGITKEELIGFDLAFPSTGKVKAAAAKQYLSSLLKALDSIGIKTLLVANGDYFKYLTGTIKVSGAVGYIVPCTIKGYEHMSCVLSMDSGAIFHDPTNAEKIKLANETLASHHLGSHSVLGEGVIKYSYYPDNLADIETTLNKLHTYPELTIDIETLSLKFYEAGLETIAFAWNQHEGIAFSIDKDTSESSSEARRKLLKDFLSSYEGKLIGANLGYDFKVLTYELWMEDFQDRVGMLKGIEVLTSSFDDTKVIAYLATNSTRGNSLGLKELSHEFMGDYGQDNIKDTRLITEEDLLEYNLKDSLATHYVRNKYEPIMNQDNQEEVHKLFKQGVSLLLHVELTGLPINMPRVIEVADELTKKAELALNNIMTSPITIGFSVDLRLFEQQKANDKLKVKVKPISDFAHVTFNPNSNQQLQKILYDYIGLPVLDYTPSKQPSTGRGVIKKLKHHTKNKKDLLFLDNLLDYLGVVKILTAFIPAFKAAPCMPDDSHRLFGNFNLCGTVSGRLSSNSINLQNLPSGSEYGGLIKSCFEPTKGKLFCFADFNALEDRINALLTKDTNKLKVFTDGFDGHSLRAKTFFPDQLPGIIDTVESINSIAKLFPKVRSAAKAPCFLLTYQGSYHGLMKNVGMSEEQAKEVEASYHELYKESDEWMEEKLSQAAKEGFVTLAFGLRLRTPILKQTILGTSVTPNLAKAEARTAGNAVGGQSYGQLNTRAAIEFMDRVFASKFRYEIVLCALIHDAIYLEIPNTVEAAEWVNTNLVQCMEWNDLEELQHTSVGLTAELDICNGSWDNPTTLPNNASRKEILELC